MSGVRCAARGIVIAICAVFVSAVGASAENGVRVIKYGKVVEGDAGRVDAGHGVTVTYGYGVQSSETPDASPSAAPEPAYVRERPSEPVEVNVNNTVRVSVRNEVRTSPERRSANCTGYLTGERCPFERRFGFNRRGHILSDY